MKQHSPRFLSLVTAAKQKINEISPTTLKEKLDAREPVKLVDVREDNEWASGYIAGAIHLSKGIIERDIEKTIPELNAPIVVYCSGGFRCALVAETLQTMGYSNVSSLETGTQGWLAAGYQLTKDN